MTSSFLKNEVIRLVIFIVMLGVLHYILLQKTLPPVYATHGLWKIYLFLITISLLGLLYITRAYKKDKTSMIKTFMQYTIVKIVASLVFLFPWLYNKDETSEPMTIQFFAVFFPLLLMETRFLVRVLNNSDNEIEKS